MSVIVNPKIVTDGLILDVDAASLVSVPNLNRNILTYSEDITNVAWTQVQMSVTPNATLAPDGTMTADMITSTGVDPYIQQTVTVVAGVPYTVSVWVKAGPNAVGKKGFVWLWYAGTASSTDTSGYGAVLYTLTDQWQRTSWTTTPTVGGTAVFRVDLADVGYSNPAAGDVYYMWGAQVEQGLTATTYIPQSSNITLSKWNNLSTSTTITPNLSQVQVLVVAGGGGGGNGNNNTASGADAGAGGGAGGLIYNTAYPVSVATAYTVTVGTGGIGGLTPNLTGSNGTNSVFGSLTAIGGGAGSGANGSNAASGGSGGGAGGGGAVVFGGQGTDGQGFKGGNNAEPVSASPWSGSGGGGAGGPGLDYWNPGTPTPGGPGLVYDISGTSTYYAGGGGGGAGANGNQVVGAAGGLGGGGAGGNHSSSILSLGSAGANGTPNTGGGGGGAAASGTKGGDGGSGIVIVRYPKPIRATGGTITIVDNNIVHTFTASGTFSTLSSDIQLLNSPIYFSTASGVISFNGTTQYAPIPTAGLPYGASPSTMEVWLRCNAVTTATGYQFALSYGTGASNQGRHIGLYNDRFIYGTYGFSDIYSGYGILPLRWYHVVGTYDGGYQYIYINGELLATTGPFSSVITESTAQIGRQVNSGQYWNGQIAKAAIYNKALSASEVKQNFNALRGRFGI